MPYDWDPNADRTCTFKREDSIQRAMIPAISNAFDDEARGQNQGRLFDRGDEARGLTSIVEKLVVWVAVERLFCKSFGGSYGICKLRYCRTSESF